jgi:hypothetical protein
MRRRITRSMLPIVFAAAALLPAVAPAAAQVALQPERRVTGTIADSDQELTDGSRFDEYTYRGRRGERITITMRSSAFDTYLYLGREVDGRWTALAADDDGAGGTDSRIAFQLPADGEYVIRANALNASGRGRYTLLLQSHGVHDVAEAAVLPILPGQTLAGTLDAGDATDVDGSYYDSYTFNGRRGDRVRIVLQSADFDAYLVLGRMVDGDWEILESDDDGAGGTDAMIELELPADGEYVIRVNTLYEGETGAYTLHLQLNGAVPAGVRRAARS